MKETNKYLGHKVALATIAYSKEFLRKNTAVIGIR